MKAKQDMKVLEGFRVVMKVGSNYVITPGLERFVGEEIQEYLPPKRRWYEELMH